MSNDSYTETSTQSWLSRLGNSFKGMLFAIVLFVAATMLLFWNEGRTVGRAEAIKDAQETTISMENIDTIDPNYNGKLVHSVGVAKTKDVLTDNLIGISQNGINLKREVEFYQWVENESSQTEKNTGGSTTTTTSYTYEKDWAGAPIDSSMFKKPEGHKNMVNFQVEDADFYATNVTFGAYRLPDFLIKLVNSNTPLNVNLDAQDKLKLKLKAKQYMAAQSPEYQNLMAELIHIQGNEIYIGQSSAAPQVGDVRITYTYTPDSEISLIAKVAGDTFVKYFTKNGQNYFALAMGADSAQSMYKSDKDSNTLTAWGLRLLGLFLVCVSLSMFLAPIVTLADVLPFLGNIVSVGTKLTSNLLGTAWSVLVIAAAWFYYRPVVAIILIVISGGIVYLFAKEIKNKKTKKKKK